MRIPKLGMIASIAFGLMTAFATAGPAPVDADNTGQQCGACSAGVVFHSQVFPMQTTGCTVTHTISVKDGDCVYNDAGECVMLRPCKYLLESKCAGLPGQCQGLLSIVYLADGTLIGSINACSAMVMSAPYCNWATLFTQVVWNPATNEAQSRFNGAWCTDCPERVLERIPE